MKISIICFTEAGAGICVKLMKGLTHAGDQCEGYGSEKFLKYGMIPLTVSLTEWTRTQFFNKEGIIFIGAAGIAVRAIAPFLKSKAEDPAVVVLDEQGRFSISLLSGHLGGANELAERAAQIAGGQSVITTATDIRGEFAVDLFAKNQRLVITELRKVKEISAAVLKGERVGFFCDFPLTGTLPRGLVNKEACRVNLWITIKNKPDDDFFKESLKLIPKLLVLGIGCRKGISADRIEYAVNQVFEEWNLSREGLAACASIDLKKEESGICEYAAGKNVGFYTFPAPMLAQMEGEYSTSAFVKQVTGVDNVCERAAYACVNELGGGRLLVKKQAYDGVTIAVAVRDWKVEL